MRQNPLIWFTCNRIIAAEAAMRPAVNRGTGQRLAHIGSLRISQSESQAYFLHAINPMMERQLCNDACRHRNPPANRVTHRQDCARFDGENVKRRRDGEILRRR
jgi:hypothetical protein